MTDSLDESSGGMNLTGRLKRGSTGISTDQWNWSVGAIPTDQWALVGRNSAYRPMIRMCAQWAAHPFIWILKILSTVHAHGFEVAPKCRSAQLATRRLQLPCELNVSRSHRHNRSNCSELWKTHSPFWAHAFLSHVRSAPSSSAQVHTCLSLQLKCSVSATARIFAPCHDGAAPSQTNRARTRERVRLPHPPPSTFQGLPAALSFLCCCCWQMRLCCCWQMRAAAKGENHSLNHVFFTH